MRRHRFVPTITRKKLQATRVESSKTALYARWLRDYKLKDDLPYLEDALLLYRANKLIQMRIVLKRITPNFVEPIKNKGRADIQLELAIRTFKALQVKDTLGLRKKYFTSLSKATHTKY